MGVHGCSVNFVYLFFQTFDDYHMDKAKTRNTRFVHIEWILHFTLQRILHRECERQTENQIHQARKQDE